MTKNTNSNARARRAGAADDDLTPEQNLLFTRLERIAEPIARARADAALELGLARYRDALEHMLMLKRPPEDDEELEREYVKLRQKWDLLICRFDEWILSKLRAGTMVAFGIRQPVTASTVAMPIPTGLWYLLALDVESGAARNEDWSYIDIRVFVGLEDQPGNIRGMIERGLWMFGKWMMDEKIQRLRQAQRLTKNAKTKPGIQANVDFAIGSRAHPLHVVVSGVDEKLIFKTETIRRNTRHGKQRLEPGVTQSLADDPEENIPEPLHGPVTERGEPQFAPSRTGPWSVMPQIRQELQRRAKAKQCKSTWAEESVHLQSWARKFKRNEETKTADPPTLKTIRGVLRDEYYERNPEFDRRRKFRHDS